MGLETSRRDLRRFRPGDSCDDCNAGRWYSDSGFRYCENGHLIEVRPILVCTISQGRMSILTLSLF